MKGIKELLKMKTTWAGVLAIVGGVFAFINGKPEAGTTAVITGMGLIFASDAKKGK